MNRKGDPAIGKRAAVELLEREALTGISTRRQLERMGLDRRTLYAWGNLGATPSGDALAGMANAGYDVIYILTGRRTEK